MGMKHFRDTHIERPTSRHLRTEDRTLQQRRRHQYLLSFNWDDKLSMTMKLEGQTEVGKTSFTGRLKFNRSFLSEKLYLGLLMKLNEKVSHKAKIHV